MADTIKIRRDIEANWNAVASTCILAEGEIGIITDKQPLQCKVGNGTTNWANLQTQAWVGPESINELSGSLDELSGSLTTLVSSSYSDLSGQIRELSGSLEDNSATLQVNTSYIVCSTASGSAAKVVNLPDFELSTHCRLVVRMAEKNVAASPTLNVNSTGAVPLWFDGALASADNSWSDGDTLDIYYDGTVYNSVTLKEPKFGSGQAVNTVGIDSEPTAESENLVKSGGVFKAIQDDAVFDVSAHNLDLNQNPTPYESLALALAAVPAGYRKGGMSIKFIQTSDNNSTQYVQYMYTGTSTAADFTNEANWEKMNLEEEVSQLGLKVTDLTKEATVINLAAIAEWTNGGVIIGRSGQTDVLGTIIIASAYSYSNYLPVNPGDTLVFTNIKKALSHSGAGSCFYDLSKVAVQGVGCELNADADGYVQQTVIVPEDAYFIRFSKFSDDFIGAFEATNTTTNGVIKTMQDDITEIGDKSYNKIPFATVSASLIASSNGGQQVANGLSSTDFVDVSLMQNILYTRIGLTQNIGVGMAFYDENKDFISSQPQLVTDVATYVITKIAVPSGAKYARFTYYSSTNPGVFWFANADRDPSAKAIFDASRIVSSLQSAGERISINTGGNVAEKTGATRAEWTIMGAPSMFVVLLVHENTADNVTLNINDTGAYPLYYNGAVMSAQNKPLTDNAQLLVVKTRYEGSPIYVAFSLPRLFDEPGTSKYATMTQDSITNAINSVGCVINPTEGKNMLNGYISELYLVGTDTTKRYYISSLSYKNGGALTNSLVIKEQESETVIARFYDNQFFSHKEPEMLVPIVEQNASGISGYAVVDWKKMEVGALITNPNKDLLITQVTVLDFWPIISEHLKTNGVLNKLTFVEDDGVIATAWNYVLKDVTIEGVRYLQFSDDLGETFTRAENTYGDIVYVHFFSNGVCLFATANKCYYFDDITNIQESSLIDENGNTYVSDCILDFFQNDQSRNDCVMVDNKELAVWGNYSLGVYQGTTWDANYEPRVWYTADYGVTVKCAKKWTNTEVRHIHGAFYNPYSQRFLIATGDTGEQCRLYEAIYTPLNDKWTFTELGRGDNFKFGDILFREKFVYFVTDYTLSVNILPRGILRCPYNMLSDYTKYQYICKLDSSYTGSLIGTLEDENGNKLLFPDGQGAGKIWYCKHNFKFVQIPMSESVVITNIGSPNYNGEIYARKSQGSASFPFKLSPMVNLTKSMRNSGCADFFVQDNVLL